MKKGAVVVMLFLCLFSIFAQQSRSVYFDFSQKQPNMQSLSELRNWIKQNPKAEILKIHGYCDTIDTKAFNITLATQRIESVLSILKQSQIVTVKNIEKIPFGESFDFSMNQSENRKVTFWYNLPIPESSFNKDILTAQVGDKLKLRGLNFFGGKDEILPRSEPVLKELLQIMQQQHTLKIAIQGHICCSSNEDSQLSTRRAKTVYDYLVTNGIDKSRLSYQGFSSTQPLYPLPEKTLEEQEANRRVEIQIVSQ